MRLLLAIAVATSTAGAASVCPTYAALPLPATLGIDGCVGNNLKPVLDALLAPTTKCSLKQMIALPNSQAIKTLGDLVTKIVGAPDQLSAILYDHMKATSAAALDAFCTDWAALVAPCVSTLLPVVTQLAARDSVCCGQISDTLDLLNLVVPPTVAKEAFVLNELVDGINQFVCAKRADTKQTCGASIYGQLTTKFTRSEFRVVESFLLPFVGAARGHECNAFEGLTYTSSLSLQPTTAIDLSCCVDFTRPLLESVANGFEYVVSNSPLEWLNGLMDFSSSAAAFVDSLKAAKNCSYKTTCSAPSGLIAYKPSLFTPGTNDPKKNALAGTTCTKVKKCDVQGTTCSEICAKGSVQLPATVAQSLKYQRELAFAGPICFAQLPATHNSAITLADGFGNRDQLMNLNLSPTKPYSYMKTNNHVLSMTDQLGVGVRWLEIDVHYFLKDLRTAHCGNLGSNSIQILASTLQDELSKYGNVTWSADLLGCFPSLSGIKAEEQPTTRASMEEVRKWLGAPGNENELIFIYMDTGGELTTLGKMPQLNALMVEIFGDLIVPIAEWEALAKAGWTGPDATLKRFIDQGRRVVLLANENTGLAYPLGDFCKGHQILQTNYINDLPDANRVLGGKKIYGGDYFLRSYQSVLRYISLGEDGQLSQALPTTFNSANIYNYVRWNVNLVATDALDGSMVSPQIWSWAENEPKEPVANATVFISPTDGRWRTSSTAVKSKKACWNVATLQWSIVEFTAECASGSAFAGPRDAYQNYLLHQQMSTQKIVEPVVINARVD